MYPYHNKIKMRIANGEFVKHEFVDKYNSITEPCLLLYFNTHPYVRPIRRERFGEYSPLLGIELPKSKSITNIQSHELI